MHPSTDLGSHKVAPVIAIAGDLCPHCGDPCPVMGRCPSCNRLLRAIAGESTVAVDEHLRLVADVVRHGRKRVRA